MDGDMSSNDSMRFIYQALIRILTLKKLINNEISQIDLMNMKI